MITDRYYTSLPLAMTLNASFIGTVIKNRVDLPDAIRSPSFRLANDEIVAYRTDCLLSLGWQAAQKNKPLFILSTESSANPIPVTAVATGRTAIKPTVVNDYNWSMNGVDKADQHTVYYSFIRRSHKWWVFWLFEVTLVNSYILYQLTLSARNATHAELFHQPRPTCTALNIICVRTVVCSVHVRTGHLCDQLDLSLTYQVVGWIS